MGRTDTTFDPDFDTPYTLHADGNVTDSSVGYIPTVCNIEQEGHDVTVEDDQWNVLKGYTGQYGYSGAVMHPSEQWGQWAIDGLKQQAVKMGPNLTDAPVTFAVVEVMDEDGSYPDSPIGWAVVYRVERTQ